MSTAYQRMQELMHTVTDLGAASAVLGWDQETYMPDGAVAGRAEQLATLSTLIHRFSTNEAAQAIASEILAVKDTLTDEQQRVAGVFAYDVQRATKLPADLVEESARVASFAQDAWKRAREASDFSIFQPLLEKIVELKRREADLLGTADHPYDNLIETYEPGMTVALLTPVFDELREGTKAILANIDPHQASVNDDVLYRSYPSDQQLAFAKDIVRTLGFDFNTGRVDLSAHPFCTNFGASDVRLTTRIRENDLRSCLFGLVHEAGHGMYEQGIGPSLWRTFAGQGASMGIHESQSLFWENVVARSEEFWSWCFPKLRDAFPHQLGDQTPTSFFKAINCMKPSLNRVESDELTYNLHIILRFELERDLIAGAIEVRDVPELWNQKMRDSLGVVPPNDREGCLQVVHWSFGGIGYFPSYTLGKLYAAMEWNAMQIEMPEVRNHIANGEFDGIRSWLRDRIHTCGRTERPNEILQRVCGRSLTSTDFLEYVGAKAARVYGA